MNPVARLNRMIFFAATAMVGVASQAEADVVISTDATADMVCGGGICSPTAADAVLNVNDLENLLASGNVEVTTTGSGAQASNIDIATATSWSSPNALTLDAYESIRVESAVSTAGLSGLTLTTNDGGTGGTLSFGSGGNVAFANLSSALTINGVSYTLVDTIQSLAAAVAVNPSGNYGLANPYDAKNDGTYMTVPIPTTFLGIAEGLGNTISHLNIKDSTDENIGLFAQLGSGGTIRDLGLPDSKVSTASSAFVGILVGFNHGTIYGCSTGGVVNGNPGPAGAALGGLDGTNDVGSTISFSHSSASVSNKYGGVGGLTAGSSGIIEYSYATGNVTTGNFTFAGGLVAGIAEASSINASFATGTVTGGNDTQAGGLIGETEQQAQISNSYATGAVSVGSGHGRYYALSGGLIGASNNPGTVSTSYSVGAARSAKGQPMCGRRLGHICVGGSMGANGASASDVYWDTTSSGNTNAVGDGSSTGISGLTTKQLQSGLPPGFDPAIWGQQKGINHGFPYLLAIPPKK